MSTYTSNVTGRHPGPKRKLRAGYRAPLPHRRAMCRHSYFCHTYWMSSISVTHVIFFIVDCGIARFLCAIRALCVYSKFGHHPHPLGYLCAKFRFFRGSHCWASPRRKIGYSIAQSPTQHIWYAGNRSFRFGIGQMSESKSKGSNRTWENQQTVLCN